MGQMRKKGRGGQSGSSWRREGEMDKQCTQPLPMPMLHPSNCVLLYFIVTFPAYTFVSKKAVERVKGLEKTPLPGAVSAHVPRGSP
jgi:hypothetical protein